MLGTYHLTALFDILNKIHFVYEPVKLWNFVLEHGCQTLQSEAGTFFALSEDEKNLSVTAAYGVDVNRLNQAPFRIGTGVCGWVAQYHQPALVNDVRTDNRFNKSVDMVTGFQTKSILCVPIFSMKRTYGVLEIINRKNGQFGPQDQEFMTLLGRQAAIAYQNLLLIAEVSQKEMLLDSILQNLSGGLIAIDDRKVLMVVNPSSRQLLQLGPEAAVGKSAADALKSYPWLLDTLTKTKETRQTVSRQETLLTVGGQEQRFGYTTILISNPAKEVLGAGIIFQKLNG